MFSLSQSNCCSLNCFSLSISSFIPPILTSVWSLVCSAVFSKKSDSNIGSSSSSKSKSAIFSLVSNSFNSSLFKTFLTSIALTFSFVFFLTDLLSFFETSSITAPCSIIEEICCWIDKSNLSKALIFLLISFTVLCVISLAVPCKELWPSILSSIAIKPIFFPESASTSSAIIFLYSSALKDAIASCFAFKVNSLVFNSNALFISLRLFFSASILDNKLGYFFCNSVTALFLFSLVIVSSLSILESLSLAESSLLIFSTALIVTSFNISFSFVTPVILAIKVSKFAIKAPTKTTNAAIPVAIIAALKFLKLLLVTSTESENLP